MTTSKTIFDAVIIGGGPAGLSAAIWCSDLGLTAVLVEASHELGGNLLNIFNSIENYPGFVTSNGCDMRDAMQIQAVRAKIPILLRSAVRRIHSAADVVDMSDGSTLRTRHVILATGVRRRKIGIPGEESFVGRGIMDSGSRTPSAVKGERVAVVGGGDAAIENAAILAPMAKEILLIHRGSQITARPALVEAARANNNVQFLLGHRMISLLGDSKLNAIIVEDVESGENVRIEVDKIIFRVGVEPNSDLVKSLVAVDEKGFVKINSRCETSMPNLFAIGDVANPDAPTISSAVGHGATAAKIIRSKTDVNRDLS